MPITWKKLAYEEDVVTKALFDADTFLYADVAARGQVGQPDYPWEQLDQLEKFQELR